MLYPTRVDSDTTTCFFLRGGQIISPQCPLSGENMLKYWGSPFLDTYKRGTLGDWPCPSNSIPQAIWDSGLSQQMDMKNRTFITLASKSSETRVQDGPAWLLQGPVSITDVGISLPTGSDWLINLVSRYFHLISKIKKILAYLLWVTEYLGTLPTFKNLYFDLLPLLTAELQLLLHSRNLSHLH